MEKRVLGRTGLEVSHLAMGGGQFWVRPPLEQARGAVHRALELGMNLVDTAAGYNESEAILGQVLEDVTVPYYLCTKLGGKPQPFNPQDKDGLRWSLEESLRLLKRDAVDILMIHEPDRPLQYDWWSDPERFYGPVTEALAEFKTEGLIRFTGLGGTTCHELARIIDTGEYDVVLTAFNYSLLWREAEWEVLPTAKKHNCGVVAGSPLQQGALVRRFDEEVNHGAPWMSLPRRKQYQALYAYLDEIEMPITECAMRFCISQPDIHTVLTGARTAEEVEENMVAVGKGPLLPEVLGRLQEIYDLCPFRPWEEPMGLPFGRPYQGPMLAH